MRLAKLKSSALTLKNLGSMLFNIFINVTLGLASSDRARDDGFKLKEARFILDTKRNIL